MYQSYRRLLDAQVHRGADAADIEEAATENERTGRSIRDVRINDAIVTEFGLAEAPAGARGISSADLIGYPIDAAAVAKIPLAMVLRHRVLGIAVHDDELVLATSDPDDVVALDDLRAATGMVIRPVVAARSELRKLIDRFRRQDSDLGAVGGTIRAEDAARVSNLTSVEDDGPAVRYVNSLIEQAIQTRASDLLQEPTETDMRVRFRIDGVLHEIDKLPTTVQSALISQLKIMSNVDITERRPPQNGRISLQLNGHNVDLRTATLPTEWGEKVVLRVLDTSGVNLELKKLGLTQANYALFSAAFHKPHGMVHAVHDADHFLCAFDADGKGCPDKPAQREVA